MRSDASMFCKLACGIYQRNTLLNRCSWRVNWSFWTCRRYLGLLFLFIRPCTTAMMNIIWGCFREMVSQVWGGLGICISCPCVWEIGKFFSPFLSTISFYMNKLLDRPGPKLCAFDLWELNKMELLKYFSSTLRPLGVDSSW